MKIPKSLPTMVKAELEKLPEDKQKAFMEEYKRKSKSLTVAFILWLFGFHYLYFGKIGIQFLFWFTGGGALIWWLIDLFRISSMVNNYNKDAAITVLQNLKSIS